MIRLKKIWYHILNFNININEINSEQELTTITTTTTSAFSKRALVRQLKLDIDRLYI